jgi:hypothetical protein
MGQDNEAEEKVEAQLCDRTIRVKPFERDDSCKAFKGRSKIKA